MMEAKSNCRFPVRRNQGSASTYRRAVAFLRSLIPHRAGRRLNRSRTVQKVFGTDLGEHLLTSRCEVPSVVLECTEYLEANGIVQGINRRPGVASRIEKLRCDFDEHLVPDSYEHQKPLQDVHSVASALKMYFRELPNPLCTYQLYHAFVDAFQHSPEVDCRLLHMQQAVQKLPPPHYRTLRALLLHLARVAEHCDKTGMTSHNLAIVWAPNILRCKELEANPVAARLDISTEAAVTDFLICYADKLFQPTGNPPPAESVPRNTSNVDSSGKENL